MFTPVPYDIELIQDETVRITFKRNPDWPYRAGQYLLVRIAEVSFHQWHPFTVVGDSSQSSISVYIRKVGDWTGAVNKRYRDKLPMTVNIDGPFGAPSESLNRFERAIVVGTGIGITPYAGFLPEVKDGQTVDLHWIVRERVSFYWFSSLLNALHKEEVTVNTYVTGMRSSSVVEHVCRILIERHRTVSHPDSFITGLACETVYGRPNISDIFTGFSAKLSPTFKGRIGVFYCGPNYLGMELADRCFQERDKTGVKWEFVGEVF